MTDKKVLFQMNTIYKKQDAARRHISRIMQIVLSLAMIVLTVCMMLQVRNIQGDARVVNYAGILRGATQREVKLEIAGQPNDALISDLDAIFDGLLHGGGKYKLTRISDLDYQDKLKRQFDYWQQLKSEIGAVRENGYAQTKIIAMSETYFQLADDTVTAAEVYSQKCATNIRYLEYMLSFIMAALLGLFILQSIDEMLLRRRNSELNRKAYIDMHTGLPNKSRCEELLTDRGQPTIETTVAVFDLNSLKQVNDSLGHLAGDTLIANFASILRTSIPEQYFVGRYGGDEFVAVLSGAGREQTEDILHHIRQSAEFYNASGCQLHIDYACGYSVSSDFNECNFKILFEQADRHMYEQKKAMKTQK